PAVLEQKAPAMFSASERHHPMNFSYAWTDEDRITIELPEGFQPEPFAAPVGYEAPEVGGYNVSIQRVDDRTVQDSRDFFFGANAHLEFPVSAYSAVKAFFDRAQQLDRFTITLRQAPAKP